MANAIPRAEYPRPQFLRDSWINLNGEWEFEIDYGKSGMDRKFYERESLNDKIIVPFCPESELSGINHKDFMHCVWYRKNIEIPAEYSDKQAILNFGAVDYHAIVFVNGKKVGEHKGGYTSFSFDITDYLEKENNSITVCAYDDIRSGKQPRGKQCGNFYSMGCDYTRTTGIWQTVWMEFADKAYVEKIKVTTDIDTPSATVGIKVPSAAFGKTVSLKALWDGKTVGEKEVTVYSNYTEVTLYLSEKHLWEIGKGGLYDLEIELKDENKVYDSVKSYFGLRSVSLDGMAFKVNNEVVFGRWVLDQGFYPDGIYTAPTDEALKNDILYSMELGFNGARLHEKIFEERFLYWADVLGYLVWGEHANWGLDHSEPYNILNFLPEWMESIERDFNHPALIGWCPFNETWDCAYRKQCDDILEVVYKTTKALDPTRPVIDTSGNYHVVTDIYDVHNYNQNVEELASFYDRIGEGILEETVAKERQHYDGKLPVFVSEYGGIKWALTTDDNAWGYGKGPEGEEEFINRYKELTEALLFNENIMGFCYTQLYDVEQEQNGLMTYSRKFKFDPKIFKDINTQTAAIEKKNK